jgi:adenylate cyclase
MEPFKQYQDIIEKALNQNESQFTNLNESWVNASGPTGLNAPHMRARYTFSDFKTNQSQLSLSSDLTTAANEMGVVRFEDQQIGHHPHFKHLKTTGGTEKHYIISAFIDIKGSTNLYKKYDEETNMIITNTIQLAAINVCVLFGGFIQRIQGDGLFVYFGGKNIDRTKATQQCLTALSLFTYFVKNDLKNVFEQHGIERIYTRIGVDFGDDDKVLWGVAGVNGSSEIATYSLHTSLAAKMQAYAGSNEIVVGQFVKDKAQFDEGLYSVVEDKRYIFTNTDKNFYYTQFNFDWYKYLRASKFIVSSTDGRMDIKPQIAPVPNFAALQETIGDNRPYARK